MGDLPFVHCVVLLSCCHFVIPPMFLEASLQVVGLLQNYPNECNYSLMMHEIKYVYSFFYLDYHFTPRKFLST